MRASTCAPTSDNKDADNRRSQRRLGRLLAVHLHEGLAALVIRSGAARALDQHIQVDPVAALQLLFPHFLHDYVAEPLARRHLGVVVDGRSHRSLLEASFASQHRGECRVHEHLLLNAVLVALIKEDLQEIVHCLIERRGVV